MVCLADTAVSVLYAMPTSWHVRRKRARSVEGAQEYLTIMSYIGTAHKHGMNPYKAIRSAISGNPDIIFN